jgi:hypothetical protein
VSLAKKYPLLINGSSVAPRHGLILLVYINHRLDGPKNFALISIGRQALSLWRGDADMKKIPPLLGVWPRSKRALLHVIS